MSKSGKLLDICEAVRPGKFAYNVGDKVQEIEMMGQFRKGSEIRITDRKIEDGVPMYELDDSGIWETADNLKRADYQFEVGDMVKEIQYMGQFKKGQPIKVTDRKLERGKAFYELDDSGIWDTEDNLVLTK